jgi:GNAT superfamily N-acetyltransferase
MAKPSGKADISGWADIVLDAWDGGGLYRAIERHSGNEIGHMRFLYLNGQNVIRVQGTYVDPKYRNRRVAAALGEKLHLDNPNHKLDLAGTRDQLPAPGFWDWLKQAEPDWGTTVINDGG